jgi:hypothetical protein
MVFVTVGIALVNALVRVFKLFSSRKKSAPPDIEPTPRQSRSTSQVPPAAPRGNKPGRGVVQPSTPSPVGSDGGIPDLFRHQQSDQVVQAAGTIVKVLPDDIDTSDGSEQHQKFLVELLDSRRTTIKICHNLKFGRAPAKEGQVVSFRGEYEYNDKGGSVHWTHHDPMQIHPDGWIEIDGQRYG